MNPKNRMNRGGRAAFLSLLWLSAASAMGCTKCSPTDIFVKDAGPATNDGGMDAGTDAAASACNALPDPPETVPIVPIPCRSWVVDLVGSEGKCADISGTPWKASNALKDPSSSPAAVQRYCTYEWSDEASNPTKNDIDKLPATKSANCTYITPQQSSPDTFTQWAHDELLPPLAERLPPGIAPKEVDLKVRVVVLDTAPVERNAELPSRHGRTLTGLIRESACQEPESCEVDVRPTLAMPRKMNEKGIPVYAATGGNFGLLSDLTNAVWLETNEYRQAINKVAKGELLPSKVPLRVIFNESFGFGNTDAFPKRCTESAPPETDVTAHALFDAFTAASCLGILHVAAAGNHTGGDKYREGLLCPARWDKAITPDEAACSKVWGGAEWRSIANDFAAFANQKNKTAEGLSLYLPASTNTRAKSAANPTDSLLSVGGVDYNGVPIVLTRPKACPEAVAIGIGGNGFGYSREVNPFLFGTSVSAAVASSRIAIQWARGINKTAAEWQSSAGALATPFDRSGGICGGEPIACNNIPWIGRPATPDAGQNRDWPNVTPPTLWPSLPNSATRLQSQQMVCLNKLPHCNRPSRSITADVWPQPVDPVCLKCGIFLPSDSSRSYPELWIEPNPIFAAAPRGAILVVEKPDGRVVHTQAVSYQILTSSSRTALVGLDASIFKDARVWLSGYDREGNSFSQQIFVDK